MDTPDTDGMTALHTAADVSAVVNGHVQGHEYSINFQELVYTIWH